MQAGGTWGATRTPEWQHQEIPYRADGFTVLGIERDEVGLEYVVLYRVVTA